MKFLLAVFVLALCATAFADDGEKIIEKRGLYLNRFSPYPYVPYTYPSYPYVGIVKRDTAAVENAEEEKTVDKRSVYVGTYPGFGAYYGPSYYSYLYKRDTANVDPTNEEKHVLKRSVETEEDGKTVDKRSIYVGAYPGYAGYYGPSYYSYLYKRDTANVDPTNEEKHVLKRSVETEEDEKTVDKRSIYVGAYPGYAGYYGPSYYSYLYKRDTANVDPTNEEKHVLKRSVETEEDEKTVDKRSIYVGAYPGYAAGYYGPSYYSYLFKRDTANVDPTNEEKHVLKRSVETEEDGKTVDKRSIYLGAYPGYAAAYYGPSYYSYLYKRDTANVDPTNEEKHVLKRSVETDEDEKNIEKRSVYLGAYPGYAAYYGPSYYSYLYKRDTANVDHSIGKRDVSKDGESKTVEKRALGLGYGWPYYGVYGNYPYYNYYL